VGAALMGLGGTAFAGSVAIDRNGTEAGGLLPSVDEIVWATGNLLFDGIAPGGGLFTLRGHHTLSSFQNGGSNSPIAGTEWSVVYELPMVATLVGGVTNLLNAGAGTMVWYYGNTGVGGAGTTGGVVANAVTGLGYGDGLPIMVATINVRPPAPVGIDGASGTLTVLPFAPPSGPLLDQGPNGVNDTPGITTYIAFGSVNLSMDVTAYDPNFFPNGLATTFSTDLTYGSNTSTPFLATEPSDVVAFGVGGANPSGKDGANVPGAFVAPAMGGGVPNYGDTPGTGNAGPGNNDLVCADATQVTCDVHTSGTGNTSFLGTFVPEPGSVALLGLGLGLLGFGTRKRKI
jgi:hypothetical protein